MLTNKPLCENRVERNTCAFDFNQLVRICCGILVESSVASNNSVTRSRHKIVKVRANVATELGKKYKQLVGRPAEMARENTHASQFPYQTSTTNARLLLSPLSPNPLSMVKATIVHYRRH